MGERSCNFFFLTKHVDPDGRDGRKINYVNPKAAVELFDFIFPSSLYVPKLIKNVFGRNILNNTLLMKIKRKPQGEVL